VKTTELSPERLSSVRCPTCGVGLSNGCIPAVLVQRHILPERLLQHLKGGMTRTPDCKIIGDRKSYQTGD
jgi:hypothetical protein